MLEFRRYNQSNRERLAMVSSELLEILACPETKQPVKLADKSLVENLNQLIDRKELLNRGGNAVEKRMDSALIREDGKVLYPVIEDIPQMLIDEGIPLESS